jgi:hypothetical protein
MGFLKVKAVWGALRFHKLPCARRQSIYLETIEFSSFFPFPSKKQIIKIDSEYNYLRVKKIK